MKSVVSYVPGCAGDFIVNCCNTQWLKISSDGSATVSASVRKHDTNTNDAEWLNIVNDLPYNFVGSHLVDRLLRLPVNPIWVVVPDFEKYKIWARRDFVTRDILLSPYGDFYELIKELVKKGKELEAAEKFILNETNYNWNLVQMRLVQSSNKVDISDLLEDDGIDSLISQLPYIEQVKTQCRIYHKKWREAQPVFSEDNTVRIVSEKLSKLMVAK